MKGSLISIILFFFTQFVWSQEKLLEHLDFDKVIEEIFPQQDLEVNYNDLYDRLFSLYSNPIDLNNASRPDFQSLFFLSEKQIDGIMSYRESYGDFLSIFELLTIDDFNNDEVKRLSHFITIDLTGKKTFKEALLNPLNHELFLRYERILETKKGYLPPDTLSLVKLTSRYAGKPDHLYARYLYANPGYFSLGFTIEKDPGEKLIWDPETSRYGMDYYSFHTMIENRGIFKKILIGDFNLDYGQGLVFGSGFNLGKGVESVTTIRRNSLGLRPYRSIYENRDFSGFAVSTQFNQLTINIFVSNVKRDITLNSDSLDSEDLFFSSIRNIGLHRTTTEILAKNQLNDRSVGGNISLSTVKGKLDFGLNGIMTNYNISNRPNERKYNQFEFSGTENYVGSFYANYYLKNAHLFGEFAASKSGGKAISIGVVASLSSQVQTSLHYRNHEKDFHSLYGTAFGENTKIANEAGIYWGLKLFPVKKLQLTTYLDLFKFPWLKYRVDRPSRGSDFMVSCNYDFNEDLNIRAIIRSKRSEMNFNSDDDNLPSIIPRKNQRILFNLNYNIDQSFSTQSRVQYSWVELNENQNTGFLIAQDISYRKEGYSLSARFSLFDTNSYESRQFIYERDLLYVYRIPVFFNRGIRYYLVGKMRVNKNVDFWLKIARTYFIQQEAIGSGLEEIDDNKKTTLSAQLRLRL